MSKELKMLKNKLEEFEKQVQGYMLTTHGRRTVVNLSNIITHIHEMDNKWRDYSPSFSPFYAFNEEGQAMWAALWSGVYLEMSKDGNIPIEAMQCMKLKVTYKDVDDLEYQLIDIPTNGLYFTEDQHYRVESDGLTPYLSNKSECIRETYYVFALLGVEKGWWDKDILGGLPPRQEKVLFFMEKAEKIKKATDILDMLDGPPDVTLTPSPNHDSPFSGECENE